MPDVKFSNQYPYTDFHELNLDWVIDTVKHWSELVGKTIQSITLTGTTGLVDTYTINYSDGTTSTFNVTNGRGIVSIVMTSVAGLVATYTVTYNDGTTSTFDVTDGRGIVSIEKTATVGLTDTYTITYNDGTESTFEVENGAEAIDATLTLAGYAADAKAVGDALDLKQNKDDPIALADNLTPYSPDSGVSQDQPFILQGTGTGNGESVVDTGSYAQIQNKNGNSAGVNQLFPDYPDSTNTIDGVTITAAGGYITLSGLASADIFNAYELQFTPVSGRKYLIMADASGTPAASGATWQWYLSGGGLGLDYEISRKIYTATDNSQVTMRLAVYNGVNVNIKSMMPHVIDLSLWFGSTANIPSHLLSHPEDFGRYYSGSLAYNPGQLVNADGRYLKSISRNCNSGNGDVLAIPNQAYYCKGTATITYKDRDGNTISTESVTDTSFTTPADCFGFAVSGTVTISLYYSGESGYDSDYPYRVLAQIDTGSEVLRSAGTAADEKLPNGQITRKVGDVDLGSIEWSSAANASGQTYCTALNSVIRKGSGGHHGDFIQSNLFVGVNKPSVSTLGDGEMSIDTGGNLQICKSSFANYSVAQIKTALSGVYLYYELATPTTEQGTPFSGASADNFAIDDFGSMMWTQSNGVPQGAEIFYPYDYKAAVDTLLNMVSGDVDNLATDAELATVAGRVPTAPTGDGTYVLKATVSGGVPTYSWVAE